MSIRTTHVAGASAVVATLEHPARLVEFAVPHDELVMSLTGEAGQALRVS